MPGLILQREGGLGTGCKEDIASPSSVMVEGLLGVGGTEDLEGVEMGFKETVGRQGRLVDVMPCGGELDEGRKMVLSSPDFCWS